jgi:hypothetical protein
LFNNPDPLKSQKFYLDEQKTLEISISWHGMWKDITVTENGEFLGKFANFTALKAGSSFHLSDDSILNVHYSTTYGDQGLRLMHNGRPLKGTSGDPEEKLKGIFVIACIIGGLNFILGFLVHFEISEMLVAMGANGILCIIGILIGVLGYVTWKKKSTAALIGIILIIGIDAVLSLALMLDAGGQPSFTGIGMKVLFIIQFSRGFSAITEYNNWKLEEDRKRAASAANTITSQQ